MIITLMPGDVLVVNLYEADGQFTISFDAGGNKKLTVHADMPDGEGREGIIYREDFSQTPEEKKSSPPPLAIEKGRRYQTDGGVVTVISVTKRSVSYIPDSGGDRDRQIEDIDTFRTMIRL